jgi:hypothetical protein
MDYWGNHHTALFNTEWNLSDRSRVYTQFTWTESSSSLGGILLSTAGLPGSPAGYNYTNVSDIYNDSNLRTRRLLQVVGFEQRLADRLVLQNELWWHDYKDGEPYLFDTNGRNIGFRFSLNWIF